ncbi:MAG: hypothetical protein ABIL40_04825 [candidate division WOR-3 bacterium]
MDLIRQVYLKFQKKKFNKPFHPVGVARKESFLIVPSERIKEFLGSLSFIAGMRKLGEVLLLLPETFGIYLESFRVNFFQIIYYRRAPQILTREFKELKNQLSKISCRWLIDLNPEPNLSLPVLVPVEKRVAFYNQKSFPLYNILIKGGLKAMVDFFQIPNIDPISLFRFPKTELRAVARELPEKKPLLFANQIENLGEALDHLSWPGSVVVSKKNKDEITRDLKKLYLCDAYFGPDDEMCEFARIFKKEIFTK